MTHGENNEFKRNFLMNLLRKSMLKHRMKFIKTNTCARLYELLLINVKKSTIITCVSDVACVSDF